MICDGGYSAGYKTVEFELNDAFRITNREPLRFDNAGPKKGAWCRAAEIVTPDAVLLHPIEPLYLDKRTTANIGAGQLDIVTTWISNGPHVPR